MEKSAGYILSMSLDFVQLSELTCIGLEAEGWLSSCSEWIPELWSEFVHRQFEIQHLPRLGQWGLMSDTAIFLAPWGGPRGRYLASWQVPPGTESFRDWKIWTVPAMTWLRIPCRTDQVQATLASARENLRTHPEWRWEGSVHEHYPDDYRNPLRDQFHLMIAVLPR